MRFSCISRGFLRNLPTSCASSDLILLDLLTVKLWKSERCMAFGSFIIHLLLLPMGLSK